MSKERNNSTPIVDSQQFKILLADDDADDCLFFEEALNGLPVSTRFTSLMDGEQLMEWLAKNMKTLPDVLFLDLNMPRKNGFECLKEIKKNPKLKHLPVIMYSTAFEKNIAEVLYDLGAHYYIRKRSDFERLKAIIHKALILVTQSAGQQPAMEDFVLTDDLTPQELAQPGGRKK